VLGVELRPVSKRLGVNGNQLVLAWMLHQELPVFPLIGPAPWISCASLAAAELSLDRGILADLNQK
jgi:aryl-alcohol dehydrogenase-like predicted oxidoreductase